MEVIEEMGIYIHIPFCKQKCYYCDFISYSKKDCLIESYIKALCQEIKYGLIELKNSKTNYKITTVYIGGGTPSYIESRYIKDILNIIYKETKTLKIELDNPEVTIEVNPGTITESKLRDYKNIGINRISIGLQTANNKLLKQIGRIHDFEQFIETFNLAKKVGIKNINVDLMLGLPNQTIQDLKDSLEKVLQLNPEHISLYSLILEENTPLYNMINKKELQLPNENIERNMYWYVKDTLELNGYNHYEISNFAKKGYISKHNVNCWKQKQYRSFGTAAHSYVNNVRFSNIENLEQYIKNIENGNFKKNIMIHEKQKLIDIKKEFMLLGLRMIDGISIQEFKTKFQENPIYNFKNELQKLNDKQLIEVDGDRIKLTNKGLDLANIVWEEFV